LVKEIYQGVREASKSVKPKSGLSTSVEWVMVGKAGEVTNQENMMVKL
jgi:hypothetical protein